MKFRTFLYIAIGLIIISVLGVVFYKNYDTLNKPFYFFETYELPVSVVILLAFLAGIIITLIGGISREINILFGKYRHWREEKLTLSLEEQYFNGLAAISEGRNENALLVFKSILDKDPRNFNALLKIGEVLCTMKRYKEAIEYHKKANAIHPGDTKPLYYITDDYIAMGDFPRAKEYLSKIIHLKPRQAVSAYRKLREIFMKEEKWEDALEMNNKVEKLTEHWTKKDDTDARISIGIKYQMGLKELAAGDEKEAISVFKKIIKENQKFIPAYIALGESYMTMNDERSAIETWNKGFEITGSPIFLEVLEDHFLEKEHPFEAIESLKSCIARSKNDIVPRFFLGKLYFRLEMLDDALSILEPIKDQITYAPTLHYLVGRIHEKRKNFRESTDSFRKVIRDADIIKQEYICFSCQEKLPDWYDRCPKCGEWSSIEINFKEDRALDTLGLSSAPVYSSQE